MSAHFCNPSLSRSSSLSTRIPYLRLTTVREKQVFDQVVSVITDFHKNLSLPCKQLLRHQWQARALQHKSVFNPRDEARWNSQDFAQALVMESV